MTFPFIKSSNGTIVIYIGGKSYIISPDHPHKDKIIKAIKDENAKEILCLIDIKYCSTAENATTVDNLIRIENGKVYYKDVPVKNIIAKRILEHLRDRLPTDGLIKFLKNIMDNPSKRSVEELYTFLEHAELPITDDGHFLAYKAVTSDFKDKHTKTIDNSIGSVVEIPRNEVDDDFRKDCSYGLHVGNPDYVHSFATLKDKIILVKVNPRDVVSVPISDTRKVRVCRYEVLREVGRETLPKLLYTSDGANPVNSNPNNWNIKDNLCRKCGCVINECECNLYDEFNNNELEHQRQNLFDKYMKKYNRNTAVKTAFERKLIRTKEIGRRLGKRAVVWLLVDNELPLCNTN